MIHFSDRTIYGAEEVVVFISYSHHDRTSAVKLAEVVIKAGCGIYLDVADHGLGYAVHDADDQKIVERIESGLRKCTHLIAVISFHTKTSWWVPYEIAAVRMGKGSGKVASLVLDNAEDLPSYIKVSQVLDDWVSVAKWVTSVSPVWLFDEATVSNIRAIPNFGRRIGKVKFR